MSLCSIKPLAMAVIRIKPAQRKNQSTGPYSGKATPWLKKALHYTYYKAKWRGLLDPNRCWKSTCPLCKSWKPLYYGTCRPLCPFGNYGLLTCCITNYPSTLATLGQITLFFTNAEILKRHFLQRTHFCEGIMKNLLEYLRRISF